MLTFSPTQSLFLMFAYLLCATPFGLVISRMAGGKDIRVEGSGNTGATNVARVVGKKWGLAVLFLDALKGFVVVKASFYFGDIYFANFVAAVAVLAHCYSIYLGFGGGKGVATALGVVAALSPTILMYGFIVFFAIFILTRIVSAASLMAALSLPVLIWIFGGLIMFPIGLFITVLVWWKHKVNIVRLIKRQEPKFF